MTPLLAQVRRGERAFERLYRRHVADVYRYALVVLRNPKDAEEVTQATFLNAYRAYARGERSRNARAWLLALTHGICRQRAGATADVDLEDDFAAHAVPDESPPTSSEIRRALGRLPFSQRAALVMRELESRSYAEIAQVLDLSPTAVETLVFEARRALREQLEGALTCREAEYAISRQIDGRLPRSERRALRTHLRDCDECAGFARSQKAQRSAWKTLARVPLPTSLQSFFGPGGVMSNNNAGGVVIAAIAQTLAIAAIGASAVGLGYESLRQEPVSPTVAEDRAAAHAVAEATPDRRPKATARPRSRGAAPSTSAKPVSVRPAAALSSAAPAAQHRAASPAPRQESGRPRPQALPVRARSRTKPPGHTQTAATLPEQPPRAADPDRDPGRQSRPRPRSAAPRPPAVPSGPAASPAGASEAAVGVTVGAGPGRLDLR